MKNTFMRFVGMLFAGLFVCGSVMAQQATVIRLSHGMPEALDSGQHAWALVFKEAVEGASGGRLEVRILGNNSAGNERQQLETEGVWLRHSAYAPDPYPITRALIEDGRRNLLLGATVDAHAPVHILQGMQDADVPWSHAMTLVEHLAGDCVTLSLIKDGDHRLSREEDIAALVAAVDRIA